MAVADNVRIDLFSAYIQEAIHELKDSGSTHMNIYKYVHIDTFIQISGAINRLNLNKHT